MHALTHDVLLFFNSISPLYLSQTLKPSLRWAMRQSLKNSEPGPHQSFALRFQSHALDGLQCYLHFETLMHLKLLSMTANVHAGTGQVEPKHQGVSRGSS